MKPEDVAHIINDLGNGKCNYSLRTIILLSCSENIKCLQQYFNYKQDGDYATFNLKYQNKHLTKDSQIFHNVNTRAVLAIKEGNIDYWQQMISRGADNYFSMMKQAAYYGRYDIVKRLLKFNTTDINYCAKLASIQGHLDIVKLLFEAGANNYSECIHAAVENNHYDIVVYLLPLSRYDVNSCLIKTIRHTNLNMTYLFIEHGADNYTECMYYSSMLGNINMVKLMLEKGANNYNDCILQAIRNDHFDIFKILVNHATNYNQCAYSASCHGRLSIVKMLLNRATNLNDCVLTAIRNHHIPIVEILLNSGVNNYVDCLVLAKQVGHLGSLKYLFEHKINNIDKIIAEYSYYTIRPR